MAQRPVYISSSVINVNTTSASKVLILPVVSSIQGNSIIIRDTTGSANRSSIYLSTQGLDIFDNGTNTLIMSNSYQAVKVVSYSNTNWSILQNYTQEYLVKNPQWIAVGQGSNSAESILYSYDSLKWETGTPTAFDGPIQTIANDGSNLWVLGGADPNSSNKQLKYSVDGTTWNSDTGLIDFNFGANGVIYDSNANKWLAVGNTVGTTGTIVYSTDPRQGWSTINTGGFTKKFGTGITKGANLYIATGASKRKTGTIQNSTDGSNWFKSLRGGFSTSGVYQGNAVATNGTEWIATGKAATSTGSILHSSDGLRWFNASSGGFPVIYPAIWVATGVSPTLTETMKYTLDGYNWSNIVTGGFDDGAGYGVAFGGSNIWVSVGSSTTPGGSIQYSTNGSNWSNAVSGGFSNKIGNGVAFGKNKWVATGSGNVSILYSSDGKNWNNAGGYFPESGKAVVYNQQSNIWIAAGTNTSAEGTLLYSSDGINWSNATSGGFNDGDGYYFGNGVCVGLSGKNIVAVGKGSNRETSILNTSDGSNWFSSVSGGFYDGFTYIGNAVAYNGLDLFVAAGNSSNAEGTLLYSSDGFTWSNANSGGFDGLSAKGIAYNGSLWIATGTSVTSNTILYSGDGSNWSNATSGAFRTEGTGVAYTYTQSIPVSTIIVSAGDGTTQANSLLFSLNGTDWSDALSGGFTSSSKHLANGVGFNNLDLWVAVGKSATSTGTILTSINGYEWGEAQTGGFGGLIGTGVSFLEEQDAWVATGDGKTTNNSILYSADGLNWIDSLSGAFNAPFDSNQHLGLGIANNGEDQWVAAGKGDTPEGSLITSGNGLVWLESVSGGFPTFGTSDYIGRGVSYINYTSLWISLGLGEKPISTIRYSADGSNWFPVESGGFSTFGTAVAFDSNISLYVATGKNNTSTGTIQYSLDLANWLDANTGGFDDGSGNFQANAIAYDNYTTWVAAGNGSVSTNSILYSGDGSNWSNIISGGFASTATGVSVFGDITTSTLQLWVATGNGTVSTNSIIYSIDGSNWSNSKSGGFYDGSGLYVGYATAYNPSTSLWTAGGMGATATGSLLYTGDASNWSNSASGGFTNTALGLAVGTAILPSIVSIWVAVGGSNGLNTITNSLDGTNWSNVQRGGFSSIGYGVAYNGTNLWVATGDAINQRSSIQYSLDAYNWSNAQTGGFNDGAGSYSGRAVAYNGDTGTWIAAGFGSDALGTLQHSSDGSNWINATSGGFDNDDGVYNGYGIAFTSGTDAYAVGLGSNSFNTILYTNDDGLNWTTVTGGGFNNGAGTYIGRGIAYNGAGRLIAAGLSSNAKGTLQYSTDGSNFINATTGGFDDGVGGYEAYGVAYDGIALWVAVGASSNDLGTIQYSSDGENWITSISGGFRGLIGRGIAYNGSNLWIATGDGDTETNSILYSGDGSNWVDADALSGTALRYNSAAFGIETLYIPNTITLALGQGTTYENSIQYSGDGTNWSDVTSGGFFDGVGYTGYGGAYNGSNLWIAVGKATNAVSTILYSSNALNWFQVATGGFTNGLGINVAHGSGLWIAAGGSLTTLGTLQYSGNGSNWSDVTSGGFDNGFGYGVAYNGSNLFVAVGKATTSAGSIQYSGDGSNWSDANAGGFTGNWGYGISFYGGTWIATGISGVDVNTVLHSTDGSNWSAASSGGFTNGAGHGANFGAASFVSSSIFWVASGYADAATGSLMFSRDGSNWSNATSGGFLTGQGQGVTNNGQGSWVAVGAGSTDLNSIQYSTDGSNWADATTGGIQRGYGATYVQSNTGLWIVTGKNTTQQGTIVGSADGLNWFPITSGGFSNNGTYIGYGVAYDPVTSRAVATGIGSDTFTDIIYSDDLINWSPNSNGGFSNVLTRVATANAVVYVPFYEVWIAAGVGDSPQTSLLRSTDGGSTWSPILSGGFSNGSRYIGNGLTVAQGYLLVATGESDHATGTILWSATAGLTWNEITTGGFDDGSGSYIGYGIFTNGYYFGAEGKGSNAESSVQYSINLVDWSNANSGGFTKAVGKAGAYGFIPNIQTTQIFVAGGQEQPNTLKYSGDGSNWSNALTGAPQFVQSIFFNNKNLWLVASYPISLYSTDGSNWAPMPSIPGGSYPSAFGYNGNNLYVATCDADTQQNTLLYSYNGLNWNLSESGGFVSGDGGHIGISVAYANGVWVATGYASNQAESIQYSLDGKNWLPSVSGGFDICIPTGTPVTAAGNGVTYGNGLFIATGYSLTPEGSILYSSDGSNWSPSVSGGFPLLGIAVGFSVAYGNGLFVAAGSGTTPTTSLLYSTDGSNWQNAVSGGFNQNTAQSVSYNNTLALWVAAGISSSGSNNLLYSGDGSNWSNAASGGFSLYGSAVQSGFFIEEPPPPPIGPTAEGKSVAWANDKWIATGVGTGSTTSVLYSYDGLTWSNIPTGGFSNGVGYGASNINRQSFALGTSVSDPTNTIITSSDGISWSNVTSGGFNGFPGSAISYKRWTTSSN